MSLMSNYNILYVQILIWDQNNWWSSKILTHISYFPSYIVVKFPKFMWFDEFCECNGDLSTCTEIEMKKHTKRRNLERKSIEDERQIHCRSVRHNQPIDRLRGLQNSGKDRTFADRLRNTSRSIGPTMRVAQQECRSIAAYELIDRVTMIAETESLSFDRGTQPIDWHNLLMHNGIIFQTF